MKLLPSCVDYITSIETPQLLKASTLQGGQVVLKNGKPLRYAGGFCVVFPYLLLTGKKVAVRCWIAHVQDADKRSYQISKQLKISGLPYFVGFDYIPNGIATSIGVFPIVIMDWIDAMPLKDYIKCHIANSDCLNELADHFLQMVKDLHKVGFSHGDLQHGNIMVDHNGRIFLVDYDSMFVPGLEGVIDEIKGLSGYQHPGRNKLEYLSPKTDYFSELIIYTSILALAKYPFLWSELEIEDTETLIFSQADIDNPKGALIFRRLFEDSDLSQCAEAIIAALMESNIENLLPLELAISPVSSKITEDLQKKWKHRPVLEIKQNSPDINGLKSKWERNLPQCTSEPLNISNITTKWRK